jgi:hypothetical protein
VLGAPLRAEVLFCGCVQKAAPRGIICAAALLCVMKLRDRQNLYNKMIYVHTVMMMRERKGPQQYGFASAAYIQHNCVDRKLKLCISHCDANAKERAGEEMSNLRRAH